MTARGKFLVMRYGPRGAWRGKWVSMAGRWRSLSEALWHARYLYIHHNVRAWIAAPGFPATVRRK
jgi:hypothetical protein